MQKNLYNRLGFTLVEMLFVLLLIALLISFALPAFRAVRFDIKNSRTQNALAKLAEARLSFYQSTKGWDIATVENHSPDLAFSFTGDEVKGFAAEICDSPSLSGKPSHGESSIKSVKELFACGFLDWHDFVDLPYTFYICDLKYASSEGSGPGCYTPGLLAAASSRNADKVGKKYRFTSQPCGYWMAVDRSKKILISEDERDPIAVCNNN